MKLVYSTTKLSTSCDSNLVAAKKDLKSAKDLALSLSTYSSLGIDLYLLTLPNLIDSFMNDIRVVKEKLENVDANYNMLADNIDNRISKLEKTKIIERDVAIKY